MLGLKLIHVSKRGHCCLIIAMMSNMSVNESQFTSHSIVNNKVPYYWPFLQGIITENNHMENVSMSHGWRNHWNIVGKMNIPGRKSMAMDIAYTGTAEGRLIIRYSIFIFVQQWYLYCPNYIQTLPCLIITLTLHMSTKVSHFTDQLTACSKASPSYQQRYYQRSASLNFERGNHKGPGMRTAFPCHDIIM